MFDRVIQYLESLGAGKVDSFATEDRNLAVAALFYHMIAVDGVVKPIEKLQFHSLLEKKFGLTAERLARFSEKATEMDLRSSGLFPFTSIINHECSYEEKLEIVEQMRNLAQSDGECHPLESQLIRNVEELLKLPFESEKSAAE